MNICIITCYNQPDYIRARTLRAAAGLIDGVGVTIIKNSRKGLLRYPEVLAKVLRARLRDKPDAYLLTFRGYEMLLPIRLLSIGKPLLYDEFINPIEWASYEHKKISPRNPLTWALWLYYRVLLAVTDLILTDTTSHADLSARMMRLRRDKYLTLPVGTDETVFTAQPADAAKNDTFTVFYYGNMLPLHGLKYVIEAATAMKDDPVKFVLIGGSETVAADVAKAKKNGASIDYRPWVEFDTLPDLMRRADLCLAGPFGDTFQAQYVITGKAYQYLAMGRPTLIGTNEESDVFTHQQDILMVPQADTQALAETIRWAMDHPRELRAIGKAGQELYYREFSVARIAERLKSSLVGLGLQLGAGADRQ